MLSKKPVLIVISLLMAVFLWVYVIGEVDPETTVKITNVPIELVNTSDLADSGLAVVQEKDLVTTAYVAGKRSAVNQAKSEGITATLDVGDAKKGKNDLTLKFNTPSGVSIDNSTDMTYTVRVQSRISKSVPVIVKFSDAKDDGRQACATSIYPTMVKVYGAKANVNKVEAVSSRIKASELTDESQNIRISISAVDGEGDIVPGIDYSRDHVYVNAQLMYTKDVTVNVEAINVPDDYTVSGISDADKITVMGTADSLKNLESVKATVDMSDVTGADVYTKEITVDLPYHIYQTKDIEKTVDVTIAKKND